jgi:hypothetical protein
MGKTEPKEFIVDDREGGIFRVNRQSPTSS